MNKLYKYPVLLLTLLIFLFISFFYGKVILNPNSTLFSNKGDGMKNYYTYAYYINNNSSDVEFEGMNYPYYENIMYTDCHPLLAFLLKKTNKVYPKISNYSIGILNILMLLSIVITAYILYFIFIKLNVDKILAVLSAIAITTLSPQILRITGHYALSYSFSIPFAIYLLLLFEEKKNKIILISIILFVLFLFFTHAYLGMIASMLIFTYAFVSLFNQIIIKKEYDNFNYLKLLITSGIPLTIFYFFIKIIDTHIGRTTNPWGIFENHAEISTILLPIGGPLNSIKHFLFNNIHQPWEGIAYIGLIAILGLIYYFICLRLVKKNALTNYSIINNLFLKRLFIASIFILLFSLLLPFRSIWYYIISHIHSIKQFRAIGRFAWVFYFVINIWVVFLINNIIKNLKNKGRHKLAKLILIIIPIFIFIEGINYHKSISKEITKTPNLFNLNQTTQSFQKDCLSIDSDKYQAIISLPFFYIGSENFGKKVSNKISKLSFLFSYHLKLPMINSYLTRTSIQESKNIMQLFAYNFYKKEIKNDLKNKKPFLIICSNEYLEKAETEILKKAKLLIKREDYKIYEIAVESLFKNNANEEYEKFIKIKDSLFHKDSFIVSDTNLYFSFVDFNKYPHFGIDNNGCYTNALKKLNIIYSINTNKINKDRQYVARFWMYNQGENFGQDCLNAIIFFQKIKNNNVIWIKPTTNARASFQINGNWSLVEVPFDMDYFDYSAHYDLIIKGNNKYSDKNIYIDKLLFFDKKLDIYKLESNTDSVMFLYHNNQQIKIHKNQL